MIEDQELANQFVDYAQTRLPNVSNIEIEGLKRIHGGASRQTYSIDMTYEEAGEERTRGVILRRDPIDSLIDTERRIEFAAIQSMEGTGLPVPRALFLEEGATPLGAPFFVMELSLIHI